MAQLSAEQITDKALEMIDQDGLEELSMRRLGKALEVDAKAIYYYFPNKDSLIEAVLKRAFAEMDLPETQDSPWQNQLHTLAHTYYQLASTHPHLLQYLLRFDGTVPIVFDVVERIIVALHDTGLSAQSIIQVIDLFWSFVPSFAFDDPSLAPESNTLHKQLQQLSHDRFPATRALLTHVSMGDLEGDLDFQIKLVIWGIEKLIEKEAL